ncbi:MAG: MFS transporter [Gordonia sp. (in: high G+C Gram-positive bacteria)]
MRTTTIPAGTRVLIGVNAVVALSFGLIAPALPSFARSFRVSYTAICAMVSIFAVARLVCACVSGRAISRLGERRGYLAALVIIAASTLACAFARSYPELLMLRAVCGIGSAMFTGSVWPMVIRSAPAEIRGRVLGLLPAGFLLGNVAGPLVGATLAGFGTHAPFVIYAIAVLLLVPVVLATKPREVAAVTAEDSHAADSRADTAPMQEPMTMRTALRHRTYRAVIASSFASGWASMGVRVAVVPLLIAAGLGASASMAGMILVVYTVGNVTAIWLAGRISGRYGRRPIMRIGLAMVTAATAFLGFAPNLAVAMALSGCVGIGSGLFSPTHQEALGDILDGRAHGGSALAGYGIASDLGAIGGPLLVGFVADQVGFGPAFLLTATVLAVALGLWFVAIETAPAVTASLRARRADTAIVRTQDTRPTH